MKLFGYSKGGESLLELSEATILVENAEDLDSLAQFIMRCAIEIREDPGWDHEHFRDVHEESPEGDIIIAKTSEEAADSIDE